MVQDRNKLIKLFIGNLSNSVVHEILEKAIDNENIRKRYDKESETSFKIAINYRNKINPTRTSLPEKDILYIKKEIIRKVKAELSLRISKGYSNINLNLVVGTVDKFLKQSKVI